MRKIENLEVGTIFTFEEVELEIVESSDWSCEGCFFKRLGGDCATKDIPNCSSLSREDNRDIIFVEV